MEMIQAMFQGAWALFGLECPGVGVSFAVLAVGFSLIMFTARLLFNFLGLSGTAAPSQSQIRFIRGRRD